MASLDSPAITSLGQKIARDTGSLLTSSLWSRGVGVVVGLVTARVLGPADFGILKLISFVPSLAKFGSFGFDGVAQREIPHWRGAKASPDKEQQIKNVSFTADLVWASLLALAVVAISLTYNRPAVRYGLWIAALSLVSGQVDRLYAVICTVDKRFAVIAQAAAISTGISALVILVTISWGRIFSVLGGAFLGGVAGILWYRRRAKLNFNWSLESREFLRQFRIALPLAGGTLAFGLFAWVERLQVVSLFGSEKLGIYMLSVTFYEAGVLLINTMLRATAVHLYEHLGQEAETADTVPLVLKPTLVLAYTFPLVGGLIWLLGPVFIALVLPAFTEVGPLLPWIGIMLTLRGVAAMAGTAMNSARLNMQLWFMLLWLGACGVFAGITFWSAYWGMGVLGAVLAKTVAFGVMSLMIFALTGPFFFTSGRSFLIFALQIAGPLLISTMVIWGLQLLWPVHHWQSVAIKTAIFLAFYIPFLYLLERQTGVFETIGRPLLATLTEKARFW